MTDELQKTKRRKGSDNYVDTSLCLAAIENEKPLWRRRLRLILKGFSDADIVKVRPALKGTDLCNVKRITEQVFSMLGIDWVGFSDVGKCTIDSVFASATFETLYFLLNDLKKDGCTTQELRGLALLTIVAQSLLYDREADKASELRLDTEKQCLILCVKPLKDIDRAVDPSIKSMIIARAFGVRLDIIDDDGAPYYKIVASGKGEFLYDVRRLALELLEELNRRSGE